MVVTNRPFKKPLAKLVDREDLNTLIGQVRAFMLKNCIGNVNACTTSGLSRRIGISEYDVTRAVTSMSRRKMVLRTAARIERKYGYFLPENVVVEAPPIDNEEYQKYSSMAEHIKDREKLLEAIDVFLDHGLKHSGDWEQIREEVELLLEAIAYMEPISE